MLDSHAFIIRNRHQAFFVREDKISGLLVSKVQQIGRGVQAFHLFLFIEVGYQKRIWLSVFVQIREVRVFSDGFL